VIGAKDPAAPAALRAYADAAEAEGLDLAYVEEIRALADEFELFRATFGAGDPDAPPHRQDDPETVARMQVGRSA
jgi:hypothetical protein